MLEQLPEVGDLITDDHEGRKQDYNLFPAIWLVLVKPVPGPFQKSLPQSHSDYEMIGQLLHLGTMDKWAWSLYRWEWKNWTLLSKAEQP